ncbi:type 1 glutamine amidotransferase [Sphingomonas sp. TZW2008]|uniref:type 1 glutamine amidotransferase n=1 Tax=Sphingomonas sp. TZW2008 TaxID=1917973 RepID=UPI000A26F95F|nr:type 1 glutamine amidotransferase [Sphingomonas sp. TZW2008]
MKFLVAESEPPEARDKRRASVGRSSGETFIDLLAAMVSGARIDRAKPADADAPEMSRETIAGYDAVFLTGSPLHVYDDTPEVRRQIAFMRAIFASGTPSFGSCAGLQVATVAAGGTVRPMGARREAGFARRLVATAAGRDHPLLAGRPAAFDAPAIHTDEVEALPAGATLLASNRVTHVQAAEIRCGDGVFWGVQYHPELSLGEVAAALRRQADDLVEHGLARDEAAIEAIAAPIDALDEDPKRDDLAWQLGLDEQVIDARLRRTELRNFIDHLVRPTRRARGRS